MFVLKTLAEPERPKEDLMKRDKYGDLKSEDSDDFEGLSSDDSAEVNMLQFENSSNEFHPYDREFKEDVFGDEDEDDDYEDGGDDYFDPIYIDEEEDFEDDEDFDDEDEDFQ